MMSVMFALLLVDVHLLDMFAVDLSLLLFYAVHR